MPTTNTTARPTQFVESIDYLKGKIPEGSNAWNDLAGPVNAKVFTVAGSMTTDIARDFHDAIVKVRESGGTLADFRKDFDQIVSKHGWTYNGTRGWRTRVIYGANMGSAMMAGRWQQLQDNKAERPYLQYRTAGDARVRKEHRQWDGIIRHIDDPFWSTHYPPNGWLCRCTVRAYNDRELQATNQTVATDKFTPTYRAVLDQDGQITDTVPVGIDPGWDHNVGQAWISPELALGQKLATLPKSLRSEITDRTITPAFQKVIEANWKGFRDGVKASSKPVGNTQILGFLDGATIEKVAEQMPTDALRSSAIVVPDNRTTHLTGTHKLEENPQQVWPTELIDTLPTLLRSYKAVLWDDIGKTLVVLPEAEAKGKNRHWKIVMRPNVKTKYGLGLQVVSLGSAQTSDLVDPKRYKLLLGQVK